MHKTHTAALKNIWNDGIHFEPICLNVCYTHTNTFCEKSNEKFSQSKLLFGYARKNPFENYERNKKKLYLR